jgi:hypothetical protein
MGNSSCRQLLIYAIVYLSLMTSFTWLYLEPGTVSNLLPLLLETTIAVLVFLIRPHLTYEGKQIDVSSH